MVIRLGFKQIILLIKQSNYIAYAVRSGISCQLPRIDRKRSLDMRKLRLCSIDQDERRNTPLHSLDIHEAKAQLRLMMKKIKNQAIGIKSCLPTIDSSAITINTLPETEVQTPDHLQSRIHNKADNAPYYIKKYKLKNRPIPKPSQQSKCQFISEQIRVPIFSVKLLKAMAKNVDRLSCHSNQRQKIKGDFREKSAVSRRYHRQIQPFDIKVRNISLNNSVNRQLITQKGVRPDQLESLQKLVQNQDSIQKTLIDASSEKSSYCSAQLLRIDHGISPWN